MVAHDVRRLDMKAMQDLTTNTERTRKEQSEQFQERPSPTVKASKVNTSTCADFRNGNDRQGGREEKIGCKMLTAPKLQPGFAERYD